VATLRVDRFSKAAETRTKEALLANLFQRLTRGAQAALCGSRITSIVA
jgi:hypothetical protein